MIDRDELRTRLCRRLFQARIGAKQRPGEPITRVDEEWIVAVLAEIERDHVIVERAWIELLAEYERLNDERLAHHAETAPVQGRLLDAPVVREEVGV